MRNEKLKAVLFVTLILIAAVNIYSKTINLEQARVMALANSRSLEKYRMSVQNSTADERTQLYGMLPSVSAGYSATMSYLDRNWNIVNPIETFNSGLDLSITQIIFNGGKNFIQKSLSQIATESVRNEAMAEYFSVLDSVDNAYYAVLEAAATLEAEESSLQTAVASLSVAEVRRMNGMINHGDFLRAMADKETRENSRNQARRSLSLNMTKFKALTGVNETVELEQINFDAYEDVIQFLTGISDEEADALYERLWKVLSESNPSMIRAELSRQRAEKNFSLSKRDYAPVISATVFTGGLNYSVANGFGTSSGGGISIRGSIPVDFWVMNNRTEKSRISRDSSLIDFKSAEINLETDLQSVLLSTFALAGSVLSTRRSLEYTERHFEFVMERYRLSQSSVSDVNDASTMLINSRNSHIRSRYGFLQSISRLRSFGAIDDEEKLIKILIGV